MRQDVAFASVAWLGTALLLSELRWFRRAPLAERLAPYAAETSRRRSVLSGASFRDVLAPLARAFGDTVARSLGVREDLALRLERVHAPFDAPAFRLRQLGWSIAATAAAGGAATALRAPPVLALVSLATAPLLAASVLEQQIARASEAWQRRLFLELPVVAEQLGMLLGTGCSVGAALARLATRGRGAVAADLDRVVRRTRQGVAQTTALAEWAAVAKVDGVRRLVTVLSMDGSTADLGRLVADEAKAARREVHRELLASVERRSQQVWIPVTVAALVPGVVFLSVPFLHALRQFAA